MKSLNKITKLDLDNVSILNIKFVIRFTMMNLSIYLFQNFYTKILPKKFIGVSTKCTQMYKNTYFLLFA